MRLILAFTSIFALIQASAAYGPIEAVESKYSENTDITCVSKVSVDCTFLDSDGKLRSCIAEEENGPFLQIRQSDCVNYGANGIIELTVTLKMCNMNVEPDHIFRPVDRTKFKIAAKEYYDGFLEVDDNGNAYSLDPSNVDENGEWPPIYPGECKTMVQKYSMDACNKPNKIPFSVQMDGNMNTALTELRDTYYGQSACYAYVHRRNVIKRFPDEIEENPTLLASPAPLVVEKISRVNGCDTKLSITCEFEYNGKRYSCIHEDEETTSPVLFSKHNECSNNKFMAEITLQMCNENNRPIEPYFVDTKLRPLFNFDGDLLPGNDIQDGNTYENVMAPGNDVTQCKTITISREIDPCRRFVPMSVRIYGKSLDDAGNSVICRSYMHRKIYMEKIVIPPLVDATPTLSPTTAQTDPDVVTSAPTSSPTPEVCNAQNVVITEVADPDRERAWKTRYTELYFDDCAGRVITDDIKFVRWPLSEDPVSIAYDLKGTRVPDDGFLILCTHFSGFEIAFGPGKCNIENDVANNRGIDTVAVVHGTPNNTPETSDVLDIFAPDVFTDGRAVRKKPATPSDEYIPSQWIVYPGDDEKNTVPPAGMDPRVWLKPIIITEITDPDMDNGNADPSYDDVPRFIEMFVPNEELHGKVIEDDLKLVLIHGSDTEPTFNPHVVLKGVEVPNDGLIVVCNDAFFNHYDNSLCDIAKTDLFDDRGGNFGCDRAAIVHGDASSYTIVDVFGLIGTSCSATTHDFNDARAVRLPNATFPEPTWEYYNWEITKGATPDMCDPHLWDVDERPCDPTDAIITEVSYPVNSDLRYVEVYFTDCAGKRIKEDVKITRWNNGGDLPVASLELLNYAVPTDGFVVLCTSDDVNDQFDEDTCDFVSAVAANKGKDPVAVIAGDTGSIDDVNIIDVFGYPGPDNLGLTPSMKDGRAVRKKPATPSDEYIPSQWIVYPGDDEKNAVPPAGMDPRVWLKPIIITEITDPDMDNGNADPSYDDVPRFIEMFVPNEELHGKVIEDDLKLVLIHGSDTEPTFNPYVVLKGVEVPNDGLIVVCNDAGKSRYQQLCDIVKTVLFDDRGGNFGCDRAAIVHGDASSYTIVDTFGPLGTACEATHDFTDARAFRLRNATFPEPTWEYYNWEIVKGATPETCDPHAWTDDIPATKCNLVITEVASPSDSIDGRFVELYSDNCAGKTIGDDFELVHYGADGMLFDDPLDLEGVTIGDDGFLVICIKEGANIIYGANTCDIVVGQDTPADNEGFETIAVLDRNNGVPVTVDIFGFKPSDTTSNFAGGRAIRSPSAKQPSKVWNPDDWWIVPGNNGDDVLSVTDMDPREWNEFPLILIITELADPLDNKLNRFIELYSPNKSNYEIVEDLILVRYEDATGIPRSIPYINLKGMMINQDGFLVLCVEGSRWSTAQCTYASPPTQFVGTTTGTMKIAIMEGTLPSPQGKIVDIFGVPTSDGGDNNFSDGRALRVRSIETPKNQFLRNDWIIIPGSGSGTVSSSLLDPGLWFDCGAGGCASDPSPSPPSAPSTPSSPSAPSKGKSPKAPSPSAPSKGSSSKSKRRKQRRARFIRRV